MGVRPQDFWRQVPEDDPKLQYIGDMQAVENWQQISFPMVVHGDAGVYAKHNQAALLTVSAKSLLSSEFGDNIFLGFAMPKFVDCNADGTSTSNVLWQE